MTLTDEQIDAITETYAQRWKSSGGWNVKRCVQNALIDARALLSASKPAATQELPQAVLDALRFYAHGHHYNIDDDHQQFDTVSGEPQNWLFSERDDDCTMIEDGSIAKAVLLGGLPGFEEPAEPIEGEVFTAAPTFGLSQEFVTRASDDADAPSVIGNTIPAAPEGWKLVPDHADADAIVTSLYRRFKDWSKRGFGPDDVTWCEVKADVLAMLAASPQPATPNPMLDKAERDISAPQPVKLAQPVEQTRALTVPSHIIDAIIDYGNARADGKDGEANKDLSYAITAIRTLLTAARPASGETE